MIGGLEGDDELADMWVAGLRSGPARWRQLCSPTSCGAGPQARWGAHAVFDPIADRIVLFGGRRTDGTTTPRGAEREPVLKVSYMRADTRRARTRSP